MTDREKARRDLARKVTAWMARPEFREKLLVAPNGTRPVVVCLPDDTVGHMFTLAAVAGSTANVLVPSGQGLGIIGITPDPPGPVPTDDEDCPVHPDTHVDMLVTYLRRRGRPTHCHIVAPRYEFGLVDELAESFT